MTRVNYSTCISGRSTSPRLFGGSAENSPLIDFVELPSSAGQARSAGPRGTPCRVVMDLNQTAIRQLTDETEIYVAGYIRRLKEREAQEAGHAMEGNA
jgi:hypothetical protein